MIVEFLSAYIGDSLAYFSWTLMKVLMILIPVTLCVAYLTLAERKVIGYIQLRLGPNRVGPKGLLQPFADVLKLLDKRNHNP
jgi:NADH-quinone oxidoreductase subunit H